MDFGASKTKLSIVESGVVRVFHVVNRGSQDITKNISSSLSISFDEAEKLKRSVGLDSAGNAQAADIARLSTDYIFSDTSSVVLAYEKKYNKTISKIIMVGGGSELLCDAVITEGSELEKLAGDLSALSKKHMP